MRLRPLRHRLNKTGSTNNTHFQSNFGCWLRASVVQNPWPGFLYLAQAEKTVPGMFRHTVNASPTTRQTQSHLLLVTGLPETAFGFLLRYQAVKPSHKPNGVKVINSGL